MSTTDAFSFFFLMAIPIIVIIGAITMGIIRIVGQQRLAELARRERIAAIERGIDPDKLPALASEGYEDNGYVGGRLRRAHGLMIGGLIAVAVGLGLSVLLVSVEPEKRHFLIGLLPMLVGIALLISSRVIWPKNGSAPVKKP